ncbi:deleted in malignant brain tumors 1 protein-like [Carcharodon carcharias]|uniref:deleted in malignant brain tumors 1 protein-like n=1 Tax=Carcharodon carcharias TaxID=13397 RepID=UPI001B7E6057|nr:deleted in malignant brain tumors 1 protein-like [Carcharodon carcharias]
MSAAAEERVTQATPISQELVVLDITGHQLHIQADATVGTSLHPTRQIATVEATTQKDLSHVRLVGQRSSCIGELNVYYRGQWRSVCSSLWDSATGEVVCKQIGCGFHHSSTSSPISQETGSPLLNKIQCNGTEASLSDCSFSASGLQSCETGAIVTIKCTGIDTQAGRVGVLNGRWVQSDTNKRRKKASAIIDMKGLARLRTWQTQHGFVIKNSYSTNALEFFETVTCAVDKGQLVDVLNLVFEKLFEKRPTPKVIEEDKSSWSKGTAMLEDGGSPCAGRAQACTFSVCYSICGRMWDMNDARVFCKYLGCGDAVSASDDSQFGAGDLPVLDFEVHCDGSEDNPWNCDFNVLTHTNCSTGRKTAGVVCSGQKGPRLVGGNGTCSGRVEILLGNTWGTVCDASWDLQDAAVVCHQLGCGAAISARGDAFFGEGNGSIWNDINECIGNELRLSDCPVASWGHHQCTHKNDAGVICSDEPWQVRLVNGESVCDGRVEVYYGGFWGRVIDTEWNFNDADVVCRQLNCGAAINVYNNWKFGKGDGPVWISNVRCNGSEHFLWNCGITQGKQLSIAGDVGVVCSDHIQVRLADGGSRCAGRVELYYNGTWGTVCDDLWDLADAHVICNQLKCGQALNATVSGWFGTGAGPIWLHNLMCATNDSVLWECPGGPWNESNCNHKEDAGVICSEHRAVRLQNGSSPCTGRVEVFYNATWGTVCSDSFGKEDAEVVCKQLSCGSVRSVDRDVTFGMGFGRIWLDDVHCRLHDSLLWQCPSSPWGEHDCEHKEDVGVICSGNNYK